MQNPIARTDKAIWTDLVTAFDNHFTDTYQAEYASKAILDLQMRKGDLDAFVSTFKTLACKSEYVLDAKGTIRLFALGLEPKLMDTILEHNQNLTTFNQWVTATQAEIKKQQNKLAFRRTGNKTYAEYYQPPPRREQKQYRHPNDRTVPMDVDPPSFYANKAYTEADKTQYKREG